MTTQKNLATGVTIILISCFLLWSASHIHGNAYNGVHINRDALIVILWLLPATASFLAYFRRARAPLLTTLGYVLLLSGLMSLIHFIEGKIGVVDFSGIEGLKFVGGIYLLFSTVSIGAGGIVGALARPALRGKPTNTSCH